MNGDESAEVVEMTDAFLLTAPVEVVLHQCSRCRYTSAMRTNVKSHVSTKCPGASILTCKCPLVMAGSEGRATEVRGGLGATMAQIGDNNTANITSTVNITVNVAPGVSSTDLDKDEILKLLQNPEFTDSLNDRTELADIPAMIFKFTKGQYADTPGVRVEGNRVVELVNGQPGMSTTRTKFIKKYVAMCMDILGEKGDEMGAEPGVLEVTRQLKRPVLDLGKKRKVSHLEAAKMYATGSSEMYKLGTEGRDFLMKVDGRLQDQLEIVRTSQPAKQPG